MSSEYYNNLKNLIIEQDELLDKILLTSKEEIDYWSLEYDNERSKNHDQFICPICQMVLVEPYSTKCGHTFCRKCILDAYSSSMECANDDGAAGTTGGASALPPLFRCPVDRHPLPNPKDIQPAPFLISSLVNDLIVKCSFSDRGCPWVDKRWLLDKHVSQDCQCVKVQCRGTRDDGTACEELALRGDVIKEIRKGRNKEKNRESAEGSKANSTTSNDSAEISATTNSSSTNNNSTPSTITRHSPITHTTYRCIHEVNEQLSQCQCGESIALNDIEQHLSSECMAISTICDLCQQTIEKPLLELHQREECPEGTIHCDAQQCGCSWTGKRSEIDDKTTHSTQCTLLKLMPTLTQQTNRLDGLEKENQTLRMHVERLTSITNDPASGTTNTGITSTSNSNSSTTTTTNSFTDSDLLHMFMECERLRRDVDQLNTTSNDMYLKQGMLMMRENLRLSEEMNVLRSGFNSLRHQIHFLLTERRSWASHYYQGGTADSHHATPDRTNQRSSIGDLLRDVKL